MPASDYTLVCRVITSLFPQSAGRTEIGALVDNLGIGTAELEQVLMRWCGLSPAAFVQALSVEHVRSRLSAAMGGDTGNGPVHDFKVQITATITDDLRRRGTGLDIAYGFHACPFGEALVMMTNDGVCGLAFVDEGVSEARRAALEDMMGRWQKARFREASADTGPAAARIFGAADRHTVRSEGVAGAVGDPDGAARQLHRTCAPSRRAGGIPCGRHRQRA